MKTNLVLLLSVLFLSSCDIGNEFVRSGYMVNQETENVNMKLFHSEYIAVVY